MKDLININTKINFNRYVTISIKSYKIIPLEYCSPPYLTYLIIKFNCHKR